LAVPKVVGKDVVPQERLDLGIRVIEAGGQRPLEGEEAVRDPVQEPRHAGGSGGPVGGGGIGSGGVRNRGSVGGSGDDWPRTPGGGG